MPRTKNRFDALELRDTLSLASVIGVLPMRTVRECLSATTGLGARRRLLPREFVVYLVVFLCLFKEKATDEVLRHLFEGLDSVFEDRGVLRASDAAISKGRAAVGEAPLRLLFKSFCRPMCVEEDAHAFHNGLRVCAIDASEIYLQCTADVMAAFPTAEADAKNPQNCSKIKFGAVMEVGSHAFTDAEYGTVLQSEQDFADALIGRLGAGVLLLGDRYYRSVLNILRVKEQGSEVLFRAPAGMSLKSARTLHDGSHLARIAASRKAGLHSERFRRAPGQYRSVTVRVIPFAIKDHAGRVVDRGRLITTLLDPAKSHAQDLIDIYTRRWEEEMGFDEIKAHLMRGAQDSLRSKTAELVRQEFWAMLVAHYLVRRIMYEAAGLASVMPGRISFVGVRDLIQRRTTAKPFPPGE